MSDSEIAARRAELEAKLNEEILREDRMARWDCWIAVIAMWIALIASFVAGIGGLSGKLTPGQTVKRGP